MRILREAQPQAGLSEANPADDRSFSLLLVGIIVFGCTMIAVIWIGIAIELGKERAQILQDARNETQNLARAFEENVLRILRSTDQALSYMKAAYERNPAEFAAANWADQSVFEEVSLQVSVIGSDGMLLQSSLGPVVDRVDLHDREHFRVHIDRDHGLFISKPVLGRASGKWSIQLSRRLSHPDGSFAGVLVVSLDPQYFTHFYDSLVLDPHSVITLVGTDGIVRARGGQESKIGASLQSSRLFEEITQHSVGSYEAESPFDGIRRIFSYRVLHAYPLVVNVGFAVDEVLAESQARQSLFRTIAVGLTAVIMLSVLLLVRAERAVTHSAMHAFAANQAKSRFLATMSHEMRTPLHGILGITDLLLKHPVDAEEKRLIETLRASGMHLLSVINDLLDFARLDADKLTVEREPVRVAEIAAQVLETLRVNIHAKGLTSSLHVEEGNAALALADASRVRQILFNLTGNALKFTERGSIDIRIHGDAIAIAITVSDTGPGLTKELQSRLFGEFSQGTTDRLRSVEGTGLGLNISQRLARLMGGDVTYITAESVGSSFTLTLPACPAALAPTTQIPEAQPAPIASTDGDNRRHILVVDDNAVNRMLAEAALKFGGYNVDCAASGPEALRAVDARRYDLILLDIMMPEMDGPETLSLLRQRPHGAGIPVVAMTANALEEDRASYLRSGMIDVLAKPFHAPELLALTARILRDQAA